MSANLEYQSDGPFRPSFRFRHGECGNDMGRFRMANGRHAYVCEECDVTLTHAGTAVPGQIERYRVSEE